MCPREGVLTWLVLLPLGDDGQSVNVQSQVPGHCLQ